MRFVVFALIVIHAGLHLLGFVKAFDLAAVPQLGPVSRGAGVLWLAAALLMAAAAGCWLWAPRAFWWVGLVALVLSQVAIFGAWSDARAGTVANVLVGLVVIYGFAAHGPFGLMAAYDRAVAALPAVEAGAPLTEADLAHLPPPVRAYVARSGALGRPRPAWFEATWTGRIRRGPDAPWMTFVARQHNTVRPAARFFSLRATLGGLPVDVLHAYVDDAARMDGRLLSLIPILAVSGDEMTRAETVTLLNDLAILAPGALVDPALAWTPIDARSARVRYTVGPNTVTAVLHFDADGRLSDFVSDDRLAEVDGALLPWRWSTPITDYRRFGPYEVATSGAGTWHPPEGAFVYFEGQLTGLVVGPDAR